MFIKLGKGIVNADTISKVYPYIDEEYKDDIPTGKKKYFVVVVYIGKGTPTIHYTCKDEADMNRVYANIVNQLMPVKPLDKSGGEAIEQQDTDNISEDEAIDKHTDAISSDRAERRRLAMESVLRKVFYYVDIKDFEKEVKIFLNSRKSQSVINDVGIDDVKYCMFAGILLMCRVLGSHNYEGYPFINVGAVNKLLAEYGEDSNMLAVMKDLFITGRKDKIKNELRVSDMLNASEAD